MSLLLTVGIGLGCLTFASEVAPEAVPDKYNVSYVNRTDIRLLGGYASQGVAPIVGFRLWWTEDHGNTWQVLPQQGVLPLRDLVVVPDEEKKAFYIPFTAPQDGIYGFKLQPVDSVGNKVADPQPGDRVVDYIVVDTQPPRIQVRSPESNDVFFEGGVVTLAWDVQDANCAPDAVKIAYIHADDGSAEGEAAPMVMAIGEGHPMTGSLKWALPIVQGDISFRFQVTDKAGNQSETVCGPCRIDQYIMKPGKNEVVAEAMTSTRKVPVFYRFPDIPKAEMGEVALHVFAADYKPAGLSWEDAAVVDVDQVSPVIFQAPRDGLFGLSMAVKRRDGDGYWRPLSAREDCDVVVLVDTHDPQVDFRTVKCQGSDSPLWIQAGQAVKMEFVVNEENLKKDGTALEYSLDDGETWHVLAKDLNVSTGVPFPYLWHMPRISSDSLLLRVKALDRVGRVGYGRYARKLRIRDRGVEGRIESGKLLRQGLMILSKKGATDREVLDGLERLKMAVGFDAGNGVAHFHLSEAYYRANNPEKGLIHLRKAVELKPEEMAYRLQLLEKLIDQAKARETWPEDLREEIVHHFDRIKPGDLFKRHDFHVLKTKRARLKDAWEVIELKRMVNQEIKK